MKRSRFVASVIAAALVLTACGHDHKKKQAPSNDPGYELQDHGLPVAGLTHDDFSNYDEAQSCEGLQEFFDRFTKQYAADAVLSDATCRIQTFITTIEYQVTFKVQNDKTYLVVEAVVYEDNLGKRTSAFRQDKSQLATISREYAQLRPTLERFLFNPGDHKVLGLTHDDFVIQSKAALEAKGFSVTAVGTKDKYQVHFKFDGDKEMFQTEGTVKFHDVPKALLTAGFGSIKGLLGCGEESCLNDGSFRYRFIRNVFIIWRETTNGRQLLLTQTLKEAKDIELP